MIMPFEKEKSAYEAYKSFLDIMLYDVPIEQLDDLVVDDVSGYGTTLDEKIMEIERLRKLVIDQREQGAGYNISFDVKPVHRRVSANSAVFIDEIDIKMVINGENNLIPLRFSTIFEFINGKWKVIHIHGSVPVNTEGDTWHKDEHKRRIEELEKLVAEKTEVLLLKNKELEIEASLERVRAAALSMNESDDLLSICEVSFKELKRLGFNSLRNAIIHIPNDEQKYFMDYDYSEFTGSAVTKIEYGSHPIVDEYLKKIRTAEDAYFEVVINQDQLDGWKNFRKESGQQEDPRLDEANALYYYLFSIGIGAIGISTFKPIDESQIKILKRFRNVFDLSYRRYTDISLAEAQAREAKIEAALEKVRGRAMAMRNSEDLSSTVNVFFKELKNLGFLPRRCGVAIIDEVRRSAYNMITTAGNIGDSFEITGNVNLDTHFVLTSMLLNWKAQKEYFLELDAEQMKEYYRVLRPQVAVTNFNDARQYGYYLPFKEGMFYVWMDKALRVDELQIFRRFTQVIGLTYRRHLDIEKAEAQARESQIQLALERVRARTMAMQKSEELSETSFVLFTQLKELGEVAEQISILIYDEQDEKFELYTTIYGNQWEESGRLPFNENPVHKKIYTAWKEKKKSIVIDLSGNELTDFNNFKMQYSKQYKSESELPKNRWILHNAFFSKGAITFSTHEPRPTETISLLERFAAVFDLTYTRFLDLQKAEARAREAKIEASLERIRAQVTAMRESAELLDIVVTMRSEFVALGHKAHYFWHMRYLPDKYERAMTSGDGTRIGMVMTLPRHIHGDIKLVADWEKSNQPTLVFAMDVDTAVDYVEKMITLGDFQQVDPQAPTLDDIRRINGLTFIMARTTHGEIGFSLPGTVLHPPEEAIAALARFAGVFDLAYKRFIDLQKAEAQNKIIQAENDRKTKELEEARELQLSMLPKELPDLPNLEIAAFMRTATEVAGDYYDFIIQESGSLNIGIGDATGHGLQAGTMITLMKGFFTSEAAKLSPKDFMNHCNKMIKEIKLGRILMSFSLLKFEKDNKLYLSSAGMPPIYYFNNQKKETEEILLGEIPLGAIKGYSFKMIEKKLKSGDSLLLITDGLPEQVNKDGLAYDYSRVKNQFTKLVNEQPAVIVENFITSVDQWMNDTPQRDDITLVVIKVK